jgi:molybdenum cofactor biosynthesis enzyme MoaA
MSQKNAPFLSRSERLAAEEGSIEGLEFLWLEITPKCNLECIHCYADSGPSRPLHETLQLEDWMNALRQAARLGCWRVQFIGGEPTLHPGLADLIAYARELGFRSVEVYTNGTHFTESLKRAFLRYQVSLSFSIYAGQDDVHDAITQRQGSFNKTLASIRWAVRSGLSAQAAIIQMQANASHVEQTRKMLEQVGVVSIGIDRNRGIGRGANERKSDSPINELCGRCWKTRLCLTSTGTIFPCVFSRFCPVGTLDQGLENVLKAAELTSFRKTLRAMQAQRVRAEDKGCNPDLCGPERDPGPCRPEQDPGPCTPEKPHVCGPEKDPGPCVPDKPRLSTDPTPWEWKRKELA